MTRKGTAKPVDEDYAKRRLHIARAFLRAAQTELEVSEPKDVGNPAMSQIVNAAIAFTDALTAKYARAVNQQDHAAAVKALRDALGNRLPTAQGTNLRRILSEKDDVQYGARTRTVGDAQALLERLQDFASWAEAELAR